MSCQPILAITFRSTTMFELYFDNRMRQLGGRMDTMTASARGLIPLLALVLLLFFGSQPLAAQLPPAIQADRLLVRAEREIQDGDYAAAAAALEQIMELQADHGLEVPEAFWFKRGQVAQEAGLYERAIKSVLRYLEVAGQEGEHYAAALELLDAAEQAVEALERAEQEAYERMQQVERAEQEARERMQQVERDIQNGDYAAAATTLEQFESFLLEHGLELPATFFFPRAQVAQEAGDYQAAITFAAFYIEEAGEEAEHYSAALELLDAAENAKAWAEASETLSRFASDLEMVMIPSGSFRMGCVSGISCENDEKPVHDVSIRSFALSKHEVTFGDWDACVSDGGCNGYRPDDWSEGRGNKPVFNVSWKDAQSFVAWLSEVTGDAYRLPTEAEWEYAARAQTSTAYSWGDEIGVNRANCNSTGWFVPGCRDRWEYTSPVGSFAPNGFGLHDMHGNVWEWVEDCWSGNYSGSPADGSAWLRGNCGEHVMRGGDWRNTPGTLRSANRDKQPTDHRNVFIGFRVARTLTP